MQINYGNDRYFFNDHDLDNNDSHLDQLRKFLNFLNDHDLITIFIQVEQGQIWRYRKQTKFFRLKNNGVKLSS